MTNRCGCSNPGTLGCLCELVSSDCLAVTGSGTAVDQYFIDPILSAELGQLLSCGPDGLFGTKESPRPNVRVTDRGTGAIPASGVETTHPFNRELWDWTPDPMHSTVVNNSRITVNDGGLYFFFANIWWGQELLFGDIDGGRREVRLRKNGADYVVSKTVPGSYGGACCQVSTALRMSGGDYMEVRVLQTSGTSGNIRTREADFFSRHFGALKLGEF